MYVRSLLALCSTLSGCFLFADDGAGAGAPAKVTCGEGKDVVGDRCVDPCVLPAERAPDGTCVTLCTPGCEGRGCLELDDCGTPCEQACVVVTNLTTQELEPLLKREHACFAWDQTEQAFLLHGGRRYTHGERRLGPGVCRLLGTPDDAVVQDDPTTPDLVETVPRAEACLLDRACWEEAGCTPPEGWSAVKECEHCFLEDEWLLREAAPGDWRWAPRATRAAGPIFTWSPQCVSAGAHGVLARGTEAARGWSSWRHADGAWIAQRDDDVPRPVPMRQDAVVTWEPGCSRSEGCELVAGGCTGSDWMVAENEALRRAADGSVEQLPLEPTMWRQRTDPAAAGVPGGAYFFGGTWLSGTCNATLDEVPSEVLSDLLFWDGATLTPIRLTGSGDVSPRELATMVWLGDRLVLFGGKHNFPGAGKDTYPGELCEFQPARGWACRYMAEVTYDEKLGTPTQVKLPRPRSAHVFASGFGHDGRPVAVMTGGSEQAARGDVWLFELPR